MEEQGEEEERKTDRKRIGMLDERGTVVGEEKEEERIDRRGVAIEKGE